MTTSVEPYEKRLARYNRMLALKEGKPGVPGLTYEAIGALEDPPLTKERVRVILSKPPKPNGRPPKDDRWYK